MKEQLSLVVGMSIAYFFSFLGMMLAWRAWRMRARGGRTEER